MIRRSFVWFFVFLFWALSNYGQVDSLSVSEPEVIVPPEMRLIRYSLLFEEDRTFVADSTLHRFHLYEADWSNRSLSFFNGNNGLAVMPLVVRFETGRSRFFQTGLNYLDTYRFSSDSIRRYQARIPVTDLTMVIGLRQELFFRGMHAQPIGKRFHLGVDIQRINSAGDYAKQQSRHGNWGFHGGYNSASGQYRLQVSAILNNLEVRENGGVDYPGVFSDSVPFQRKLIPVFLQEAGRTISDRSFLVHQTIFLGKKSVTITEDTTQTPKRDTTVIFHPRLRLFQSAEYYRVRDVFLDRLPSPDYYAGFAHLINDSLALGLTGEGIRFRAGMANFREDGVAPFLKWNVALHADLGHVFMRSFSAYIGETALHGGVTSRQVEQGFLFGGNGALSLTGYNSGDLFAQGFAGLRFRRVGEALFHGRFSRQRPSFVNQSFLTGNRPISPELTTSFGVSFFVPKNNFRISVNYFLLNDHVYWAADRMPARMEQMGRALVIQFWKRFSLNNRWFSDNALAVQQFSGPEVFRYPALTGRHWLYVQGPLFKSAMKAQAGLDVFWRSGYSPYGFFPLTGQFYLQEIQVNGVIPVLDVFINAQVKSLRVFAKVTDVASGLFQRGYYTAYPYPAAGRSFKAGLNWRFVK